MTEAELKLAEKITEASVKGLVSSKSLASYLYEAGYRLPVPREGLAHDVETLKGRSKSELE